MRSTMEDDLFCLFGAILNRINQERKKRGIGEADITDKERGDAIKDYVRKYPNDKIIWGDE